MMKLFGKQLFEHLKGDEELYDFAQHGLIRSADHIGLADINLSAISGDDEISESYLQGVDENNRKAAEKAKNKKANLTPKEVYNLQTLNDTSYVLKTDEQYISNGIKSLSKKQALLPRPKKKRINIGTQTVVFDGGYGASKFGFEEMGSLIERLDNRRKYAEFREFFDQYPYTRSDLINEVLSAHHNLRSKRVEEFIPDMPDEAIDAMSAYNETTLKLCGKRAVFYIIADKKDFGEVDKKRDPILLAQSPFALAWQILGAWDEEMIYLGDL